MKIVDKNNDFCKLRKQFKTFVYEGYKYNFTPNGFIAQFYFHTNNWNFKPEAEIIFNDIAFLSNIPKSEIDNIVFNIGMVELISYWKSICSPTIIIKPHLISEEQIIWWRKLWYNGLGEFFYVNSINTSFDDFVNIKSEGNELKPFSFAIENASSVIVPVGGGKDSPVSIEIAKKCKTNVIPLIINPRGATINTILAANIHKNKFISIRREIDANLLKMNKLGFLNGHTPFSAMLAFYTILVSRLTSVSDIALSNEDSANESTVPNKNINHQYSKSFEFENDFRYYYSKYISSNFNYFSLLRPLSELQIANLFSQMPQYHSVFRSCNVGSKDDIWCGNCPKCLFAFIILSPFLSPSKMENIFGSNLLYKKELNKYFEELTGFAAVKPFECVGTVEEVNEAINLAINKFYKNSNLPYLLSSFKRTSQNISDSLIKWNNNNFLDKNYEKTLKDVSGIE